MTEIHCPQCPKSMFASRSNLKRHMENPNIHNMPYERSRDQKRWKDHLKKETSRQETTERMRKWRAENKEKNKRNDLRCRVYRLARQRFGIQDSEEKQAFIQDEINKRLLQKTPATATSVVVIDELPFYCAPLQKIELPSITDLPTTTGRRNSHSSSSLMNTEPAAGYATNHCCN